MASGASTTSQSRSHKETIPSATSSRRAASILGMPSLTGFTKYG